MQLTKIKLYIITVCTILAFTASSCTDSDNFSFDSSYKLDLAVDEIKFDTVFTALGSTIKEFKIYNPHNNSLIIESIRIRNSIESGFTLNIDGSKGNYLENIYILKKDSLSGFVKLSVNPLDKNNPVVIRDTIEFVTNTNIQTIVLEAIGQDVHLLKGKTITENTKLENDKPYLIADSLVIAPNVTVSIEEGTKFYFRNKASFVVKGNIIANGTVQSPIIFRGDRLGYVEGDIQYDKLAGQWSGVYFHPNSYDNRLKNLHIRNAVNGMMFMESRTDKKKASLRNVIIHNNSESGLTASNCHIEVVNSVFSNSKGALLDLKGGKYDFLHCTVANYYGWSVRTKHALMLSSTNTNPLEANFANSIIYGSGKDEISLKEGNTELNYTFLHCLIKHQDTSNPNMNNATIWNTDPQFVYLNKQGDYIYDYRLKQESPAIDKANREMAERAPLDINNKSRLSDTNPDIGAYER